MAKSEQALRNFYKWFGDSKVVDEQGRPLVVYHGTLWEFDTFKAAENNFSLSWQFAYNYASTKSFEQGLDSSPVVKEVYLKAEKPFDFRNPNDIETLIKAIGNKKVNLMRSNVSLEKLKQYLTGEYLKNGIPQEQFDKIGENSTYDDMNNKIDTGVSGSYPIISKNNDYFVYIEDIGKAKKDIFDDYPVYTDTDTVVSQLKSNNKYAQFGGDETEVEIETTIKDYNKKDEKGNPVIQPYKSKVILKKIYNENKAQREYDADNWFMIENAEIGDMSFIDFITQLGYDAYYKQESGVLNIATTDDIKYRNKFNNTKQALQEIVDGSEESTVKDLRDDLSQYGGTNDVTFVWGNDKKGLQHIAQKHGINDLKNVIDTVVDGKVLRYVAGNKTVVLEKNGHEAVLSLDEYGKTKTWLFTGWKVSTGETSEVSATSSPTQNRPTFSRSELGAVLDNMSMTQTYKNVNSQIKSVDNRGTYSLDTGNIYFQARKLPNGWYDPELSAIVLTKNWNTMTLPHELHHYYLSKIIDVYNQAQAGTLQVNTQWLNDIQQFLAKLGIENPASATTQQIKIAQEQFASMTEAYLTGLGVQDNDSITYREFLNWIPEKYDSVMNIGYLDANGKIVNPLLDDDSVRFFNKWFVNIYKLTI